MPFRHLPFIGTKAGIQRRIRDAGRKENRISASAGMSGWRPGVTGGEGGVP